MSRNNWFLFGFVLIKILLQYLVIDSGYELHRDEFLHLDQAHHLDWGYISVPPVTSWFSYLIYLLGYTEFWVKFIPAFLGALTIVIVWKTIEGFGGNLFALSLAAIGLIFSALVRLNMLFQPNSFDILAWTFILYSLVNFFKTEKTTWLYWMGVGFGFGFLNKYNVAFLAIGLFIGLLVTPERKIFKNHHLYGGLGVATLIALPNIWWQWTNDFPVIWHMRMLSRYQLVNINRLDFLTDQPTFFIGSLFIIIAGLISFFTQPHFKKYRFLFFTLIATLSIFIYFRAKAYYAIGLYPIYFSFGAIYLSQLLKDGKKRYLKPVALILPIGVFIAIAPLIFPISTPKTSNLYMRSTRIWD
ncbi:glycosyltransferase family 39 protein [Algoriphagus halophilus]|uniref:glycosyltransferase family 39 protein n=1 Tax=Algoriphagus halophilus TaxID=226505 RepID=UPI00358FE154